MEFKRFLLLIIIISLSNIVIAQTKENKALQLRYDIFKEINFSTEYDLGSYLNNTFLKSYYTGNFIDEDLKNTNYDRLKSEKNPFGISSITKLQFRQLPETMLGKHNMGYSVVFQYNYYQEFEFTSDAYNLALYGNKSYAGKNANLNNMRINNQSFYQIKSGLFFQNRDKYKEYGFQVALNIGNQFHNYSSNNAILYTNSIGEYINLKGEFQNQQTSYLENNKTQGIGGGIDLYYQINKRNSYFIRVELNNLGFIYWDNKSSNYNKTENLEFNGIEVSNIFEMPSPLLSTTANDSIKNYIASNSTIGNITTFTPSDFKLSAQYFIKDNINISTLFNYRFFSVYKPFYKIGLKYYFSDKLYLGPNISYGGYTKFNIGMEFQTEISHNFVLNLQTKYLSGLLINQFSGIGAFLGINYKL